MLEIFLPYIQEKTKSRICKLHWFDDIHIMCINEDASKVKLGWIKSLDKVESISVNTDIQIVDNILKGYLISLYLFI